MNSIELPHVVTYDTKKHVDVYAVAKSLVAQDELIREATKLLERFFEGISVDVQNVRVTEVTNGSPLKEYLTIGLFFAFQDELESAVPELIEKWFGVAVGDDYNAIVTVALMLVAITVIDHAMQRIFPGKDAKELKKAYQQKLEEVSRLSGKSPQEIDSLIEDSFGSNLKKRLIQSALDFFLPAKREGAVAIYGLGGFGISEEAVREVPADLDYMLDENEHVYELHDVLVDIHRSDRDSHESGWRAIVEAVSDKKLRMVLAPDIPPSDIFGKISVVADIVIVEEKDDLGIFHPRTIHLMKVKNDDPEKS